MPCLKEGRTPHGNRYEPSSEDECDTNNPLHLTRWKKDQQKKRNNEKKNQKNLEHRKRNPIDKTLVPTHCIYPPDYEKKAYTEEQLKEYRENIIRLKKNYDNKHTRKYYPEDYWSECGRCNYSKEQLTQWRSEAYKRRQSQLRTNKYKSHKEDMKKKKKTKRRKKNPKKNKRILEEKTDHIDFESYYEYLRSYEPSKTNHKEKSVEIDFESYFDDLFRKENQTKNKQILEEKSDNMDFESFYERLMSYEPNKTNHPEQINDNMVTILGRNLTEKSVEIDFKSFFDDVMGYDINQTNYPEKINDNIVTVLGVVKFGEGDLIENASCGSGMNSGISEKDNEECNLQYGRPTAFL